MATRDLEVKIFGDSGDLERAFGKAGDGAEGMGSKFQGLATKVAGVGLALGAGVMVAKGFADAAGDLGEAQSKANVIFGEGYDQVSLFAEGASSALGLSETAATDFAASFGGLLKSTGLGSDAVAGMSTDLVTLAADLGSFNNLASDDVAQKLMAGLGGEAEPLKALGVFINAASVETKALEMGLGGVNGELTEQEKIQARYALILEQTTDAQGDFAATSGGLANSQKILGAEWENMQAMLGEKLAPAFAAVFGWLAEKMPEVIEWLGPKMTEAGEMLSAFWEDKGPAIVDTIGSIGDVVQTIWDVAKPIIEDHIVPAFEGIGTAFSGVVELISGIIDGDWSKMWEGFGKIGKGVFDALVALITALPPVMLSIGGAIVSKLWEGFSAMWGSFWADVLGKVDALVNILPWIDIDLDGGDGSTSKQKYRPGTAGAEAAGGGALAAYQAASANVINFNVTDVSGRTGQQLINEAARAGYGGPN